VLPRPRPGCARVYRGERPHLRALTLARSDDPVVKDALALDRSMISELTKAYATGRVEDRAAIIQPRDAMTKLDDVADG
jgi:hypothetical protein